MEFSLNCRQADDDNATTFSSAIPGDSEILIGTIDFVAPADRDRFGAGIQLYFHIQSYTDIDQLFKRAIDGGANVVKDSEYRE